MICSECGSIMDQVKHGQLDMEDFKIEYADFHECRSCHARMFSYDTCIRIENAELKQQNAGLEKALGVLANQLQIDSFYRDECPRCAKSTKVVACHLECWIKWAKQKSKEDGQ